jgi:hypothetical protein
VERVSPEASGAAFIPRRERRGHSPRFGKWGYRSNGTISNV